MTQIVSDKTKYFSELQMENIENQMLRKIKVLKYLRENGFLRRNNDFTGNQYFVKNELEYVAIVDQFNNLENSFNYFCEIENQHRYYGIQHKNAKPEEIEECLDLLKKLPDKHTGPKISITILEDSFCLVVNPFDFVIPYICEKRVVYLDIDMVPDKYFEYSEENGEMMIKNMTIRQDHKFSPPRTIKEFIKSR